MLSGKHGIEQKQFSNGFTLFEMVVVICSIVILYMVAEQRLNELPAAAERASYFAVMDQLKIGVNFEMYTGIAKGEMTRVRGLEGSNPMDLMLEAPRNYRGVLQEVTDTNIERRSSWYFESGTGELVYVVGGASIDDVWVTYGNTEVNYGQIRLKIENVYRGSEDDASTPGQWEAVLLEPVRPFRWERREEEPVEI